MLSTQVVPPISSVSRLEMTSPSPVQYPKRLSHRRWTGSTGLLTVPCSFFLLQHTWCLRYEETGRHSGFPYFHNSADYLCYILQMAVLT